MRLQPHLHRQLEINVNQPIAMKITLLGTGSPEAHTRRASSGYLVSIGDENILLDCGGGVFDRLLQAGYLPADINTLFFTHLHSDHMMDYARLVHAAWDEGGSPIHVYGPAPINNINSKLFGRDGVFATDLTARTENTGSQEVWQARGGSLPRPWPAPVITEISAGFRFESPNGWRLTTCSVPHAQPQLDCMAFRLDYAGKSFVYSGDAALCPALESLARDCDVLLHWCYRLHGDNAHPYIKKLSPDPVQIAQMAQRCGASQLLLTHLRKSMDTDATHNAIISDLQDNFNGTSAIAEDLMVIEL